MSNAMAGIKPRVLIFIVAYNAEKTIEKVLSRIPDTLRQYDTEILIIDDASRDSTFEAAELAKLKGVAPYPLTVLRNPKNQMYGGNQKIGYHYAIEKGFDIVAMVHGDGQYAPEALPRLVEPLVSGEADAVFGSRMMTMTGALKGGMPLYKYVGNRILTFYQNTVLGSDLSEFHTGYRLYSTAALKRVPFHLNTNDFHFDTEIIIQMVLAGQRIKELPIPTFYGEEKCHVNGLKYAWDVVKATTTARMQSYCLKYRRNFDVQPPESNAWQHRPKLDFTSSQTEAIKLIEPGSSVMVFGSDSAMDLLPLLKEKGCKITILDRRAPESFAADDTTVQRYQYNPDRDERMPVKADSHDYILMLDVIEHASSPEGFLEQIQKACTFNSEVKLIVATANVGFFIPRLMHLFGQFNYSRKGILDLNHRRLFTFESLQRVIEESGCQVLSTDGIPAPFPLVIKDRGISRSLIDLNRSLIKIWRTMFSYQILLVARPMPTLPALLEDAVEHSRDRLSAAETADDQNAVRQLSVVGGKSI